MNPHKLAENALKEAGFIKARSHGKHDIWVDKDTNRIIPLRRGSNFNENDLRIIKSEIKQIKGRQ